MALIFAFSLFVNANVQLPLLFSDGMVLQRDKPIPVWGWADANEKIEVHFNNQIVKTTIFVDKEMPFVPEKDAKGIETYRTNLTKLLEAKAVNTMLHEDIIRELDSSAKVFDVLIIKTNLTIPYTSVFFQLDCGYWNAEAEQNLRANLNAKQ